MTSSKTPEYPEYEFVPTKVMTNGQTLAQQYKDKDGIIITDISLSEDSVKRKKKLEELLNSYEGSIDVFSPELNTQFENIANSKKQSALNDFNSMYEPTARKAREDYFSRLGTLDSTAYLDRFNSLENTKQQAYADIANDYVTNLDELKNNELARRYSYLNYLQSGLNSLSNENNNLVNSMTSLSSSYTNNYNNYLSRLYGSEVAAANSGLNLGDWKSIANIFTSFWTI